MDTRGTIKVPQIPRASLPMMGFIYLVDGEAVVESEGETFLCTAGHLLLIPVGHPFSIPHYNNAVGYSGGFSQAIFGDTRRLLTLESPLHKAFWFDDAVFIQELFNMLAKSFEKGDMIFIQKGLDLLLSRLGSIVSPHLSPIVGSFMESVFQDDAVLLSPGEYAQRANVTTGHLNRLVRSSSGHSVSYWIDVARINRAKHLLKESDMPIIDVADAVGLSDQAYFARFFKRQTGMTPTAFRKLMHE